MFKPFDWSGTATRKQFWVVVVGWYLVMIGTSFVLANPLFDRLLLGVMLGALALIQLLGASVTVRRLHAIGRSGYWALLLPVPLLGLIITLWIGLSKPKPDQASAWPPRIRYRIGQCLMVLLAAFILSRFVWAPFWIPSASMKPTLLVGDYLAVSTRHDVPEQGKVYIYRHPVTGASFVGRLIGVGGDQVQMADRSVVLNGTPVPRVQREEFIERMDMQGPHRSVPRCANQPARLGADCIKLQFQEVLPNGNTYAVVDIGPSQLDNTGVFTVPDGHLFFVGDNRDNSTDSRVSPAMRGVGFVPIENLVGQASTVVFSAQGSALWKFWQWRPDRFFVPLR